MFQLYCLRYTHSLSKKSSILISPCLKSKQTKTYPFLSSYEKFGTVSFSTKCIISQQLKLKGNAIKYSDLINRTGCSVRNRYYSSRTSTGKERLISEKIHYVLILAGVYVFISGLLYAKDFNKNKNSKTTENKPLQKLNDPYMKGKDAEAFKHEGYWLPLLMIGGEKRMKEISTFSIRDSDIFVASFPKSGTTWVQQMIYLILHKGSSESKQTIEERFPYLEFIYPGLNALSRTEESPRLIKSHLPLKLLPDDIWLGKGKVVYIARNPKDVSVSYYHFVKMLTFAKYQGSFENFFDSFIEGKVNYGPWTNHVKEFWLARNQPNILFITYEDLQKDLAAGVLQIADFLGVTLTQQEVARICQQCSFEVMKSNNTTNYSWWDQAGIRDDKQEKFMRKGKVGDWQNYYNKTMQKKMDDLCSLHLEQHGLAFRDKD